MNTIINNYNSPYGWECPRCRKVNAPWAAQCSCPPKIEYTTTDKITLTTGSPIINPPSETNIQTCEHDWMFIGGVYHCLKCKIHATTPWTKTIKLNGTE